MNHLKTPKVMSPKFQAPRDWLEALLTVAIRWGANYGVRWNKSQWETEPVKANRNYAYTTDREIARRATLGIALPEILPLEPLKLLPCDHYRLFQK